MTIVRMRLNGKWENLYANEINNRLKKTENLADIDNVAIARENLELVGDVDTHNHDSRYLAMIENVNSGQVNSNLLIQQEKKERVDEDNRLDKEIDDLEKSVEASLTAIKNSSTQQIEEIDNKIQNLKNGLLSNKVTVTRSTAGIDKIKCDATTTSSGSGSNVSTTTTNYYLNTENGIGAGEYNIQDLLQKLVNVAHTHKISTSKTTSQCNCNCDCNCCGH